MKYQEKRDKTFGMTFQQQMNHFHRQRKTTRENLKALGPKQLRVTLTDCLKSPPPSGSCTFCGPAYPGCHVLGILLPIARCGRLVVSGHVKPGDHE